MHPGKFLLAVSLCGVVLALEGTRSLRGGEETSTADEECLRRAHIGIDGPGLREFFRQRSLTDADRQRMEALIRQLGHAQFAVRQRASQELSAAGPTARPLLKEALHHPDLEVVRRAELCLEEIERGPGSALPVAAARLLALRKPAGAIESLLLYLPFADDDWVEEEVLTTLNTLSVQQGAVDPALLRALHDPHPARRAAAALVLGHWGNAEEQAAARQLLGDPDAKVRLRAAQGLLAAQDTTAVPVLVALLAEAPPPLTTQVEELLCRLAGDQAPRVSVGRGSLESRQKCRDAWALWWRDQGSQRPLPVLEQVEPHLGLTLLAEMDSNKVWEFGSDGKPRWKLENLQGPIDAQVLPGGHVLIAEFQGQRVTERDLQGNVLWEKRIPNGNPIVCQRLPNGNTVIATHDRLFEVGRDGQEVYSHQRGGQDAFVFGAQKLRNGHIVCISNQGFVQELDAATGKEIKQLRQGNHNGGWCSVESLPGGHFLLALLSSGKVLELDAAGNTTWECTVPGACHATRLPNGHTLVASMMTRRVVEVDRDGKTVSELTTSGRPWRVHRR
jgi:HEAT repeat protein